MKACASAAGKLARYEHIGWSAGPQSRCWSFHSGAMSIAGRPDEPPGREPPEGSPVDEGAPSSGSDSWVAVEARRSNVIAIDGSWRGKGRAAYHGPEAIPGGVASRRKRPAVPSGTTRLALLRAAAGRCPPLVRSGRDDPVATRSLRHHEPDVGPAEDVGKAVVVGAHSGATGRDRRDDRGSVGSR